MKTTTIFGEVVDLDAPDLKTRVRLAQRNKDGSWKVNPMLGVHGPGAKGKRCKVCKHLLVKTFAKRYFKCHLREGTVGRCSPVSDHRANWPACSKFQER